MKLATIIVIIIAALAMMGVMIVEERGSTPECLEVASDSVHAYYEPAFEAALVGWFVEGEPLALQSERGDWWLVAGNGTDAMGRKARMTGWVQASYLIGCQGDWD